MPRLERAGTVEGDQGDEIGELARASILISSSRMPSTFQLEDAQACRPRRAGR